MNILRITPTYPPRVCGWSAHVWGLSKHQAALGNVVEVIQPVASPHVDGPLTVHRVSRPAWRTGAQRHAADLIFGLRAAAMASRVSRGNAPDVLHVHGDVVDAVVLGRVGRFLGIPVVLTVHSRLNQRRRYRAVARPAFRGIDGFIAVSAQAAEDLESVGVDRARIAQISSGVDVDRFTGATNREVLRRALGVSDGVTVVTFIGRLHPVKGVATLIRAARSLPETRFRVLVGGDGPEQQALRVAAGNLAHVQFLGELTREDVVRTLTASDLFVMPSVDLPGHCEGTPTSVIEAMAAGLPVIASDSGGLPGLVREPDNGIVFRQGNADQLTRAIARLADDPATAATIAARNRDVAAGRAWPTVARSVMELYGRVGVRAADVPGRSILSPAVGG